MVYALLRAVAGVALRWFYRDIDVRGMERIPRRRPLLLTVNHPNALVDALIVGWVVPRRILITAKSTLFKNPIAGAVLSWLGVLPLRRASDERDASQRSNPTRNEETFLAVHDALRRGSAVLIFPEGKSHDEPTLAPLKTGAARMALQARNAGDVPGLTIVPIGLTFERKEAPRTQVLVEVGQPLLIEHWRPAANGHEIEALTAEIDSRLRGVTLNYATSDDAARATALARVIAAVFSDVPELRDADRSLGSEAEIARRIEQLRGKLAAADPSVRIQADDLARRLDEFQQRVNDRGLVIEDIGITTRVRDAVRFVVREAWLLLVAGPFALWGRMNHYLPFHAAGAVASRSAASAADPAMRMIVAGAALVLLAYLAQASIVWWLFGPLVALIYGASLPIAADLNFYLSERSRRALARARTFLAFRRDPSLHRRLIGELDALRRDAMSLDAALRQHAGSISA
jgi:glycerol-3-phosphate O-acyltransferase/dihydroxyacetone phosphate acyltransferase